MNTLGLTLHYRPLRIGWCVRHGDFEAFRKAARRSFTLWGGRYNPIIPIDNLDHAKRLIDLYRVDCLYPATDDETVKKFVEGQRDIPWPDWNNALVVDHGRSGKTSAVADLLRPINLLYEEHYKHNPQATAITQYYDWDSADPLADVFLTQFGALPPVDQCAEDYLGIIRLHLKAEPVKIKRDGPVWPLSDKMTLASLNRANIASHYTVRNNWAFPGFYAGNASNFDDLVNFWNLRATDIPLVFFDPAHPKRLASLRESWLTRARRSPKLELESRIAIWGRRELEMDKTEAFGENLVQCNVDDNLWNGNNIQAPFMYFGSTETLASVDAHSEKPAISFSLPDHPFKEFGHYGSQAHVVSVNPGIGLFANEKFTLNLPFIPQLNEFYGRKAFHGWNKMRAEPESFGLINTAGTNHLSVQAIEVSQLIAAIFKSVGISAKPSAAGLVCTRLITQMNGIDKCRVFRIGGVRELIEKTAPDQSFTRSYAKQTILANGTSYPLNMYQELYIEQRPSGTALTNDAVLAHLLNKGIFRPGLKLECANCQLDYWRSVDDLKTNSDCEYCGHVSNIGPQLKDRDWAFRRSGLFGRNDNQEGSIPVVLTLQQIAHVGSLSGQLQTTAMVLEPDGADMVHCETDFVVIQQRNRDQKIQLAIGECKTRGGISRADVQNLIKVADAFPPEKFDVFLVFAKLSDFTSDELTEIKEANSDFQRRAIILSARELEPWFVYERTEKEFEIKRHAVSFEDMVEATDAVFFREQRKAS